MTFRDTHASDQDLILAADGELPARRVEWLRNHLAGCWECRVRARELEEAIGQFVHGYRRNLDPLLPSAFGRRALLKAQLEKLASSPASSWKPPLHWFQRFTTITASTSILVFGTLLLLHRWTSLSQRPMYAGFVPISFPATQLTPGVARAKTREQMCESNESKNRDVSPALRRKVFKLYGMPGVDAKAYEVDYLITPALGGAEDIGNLWPQSYSAAIWNARVKDALEDRLHELVCRGDLDLAIAQREISTDWVSAYKKYFHTDKPLN